MKKSHAAAVAIAVMGATPAVAQEQGTATLYASGRFTGRGMTISGPTTKIPAFTVKSLRVAPGTVWELCTGNTFTGCERFSKSTPALVRTVRSVRPVAPPISEAATAVSAGPVTGSGPSLHGLASEFFVVPAQGGARIEVAGGAAGASSAAATEFCRAHGWRMSVYERVQTVGGRTFLADTLCVNEDR